MSHFFQISIASKVVSTIRKVQRRFPRDLRPWWFKRRRAHKTPHQSAQCLITKKSWLSKSGEVSTYIGSIEVALEISKWILSKYKLLNRRPKISNLVWCTNSDVRALPATKDHLSSDQWALWISVIAPSLSSMPLHRLKVMYGKW